ncbi:hypothetical protein FRX31_008095 [Thalictrum thalictroides]|uniref:DUF7769 domain-containing protein n=1 Tax=Thalictrum thalictroides TaxID=46969 RepID=A0A7J6X0L4_THATH|nr:hypothetical protein FRX31_008095 [Thalictrum thalictroides]
MDIDLNVDPLQDFLIDLNQYPSENILNDFNHQPAENVITENILNDFNHQPAENVITDPLQDLLIDLNQSPLSNPHEIMHQPENIIIPNKKKNLSVNHKRAIVQESRDRILPKGVISKVATYFSVSTRSVSRIWNATKESIVNDTLHDTSSNMVKTVGRKRVEVDL